ncbi:hypothetical protein NYE67_10920 [Solibacillus sp. FSL W8-0474]|uniref:hypothetical protein n=1 Tax=Solibacillus sp. FSL W8-0474 TaxID=2975336 RepID=UPI0030FB54D9
MSDKYPKLNITEEAFANLDIPKFVESRNNLNTALKNTNTQINEIYTQLIETNRAKHQREVESHEALIQIAENTKGIKELVSLVRDGNEINKQTFELIQKLQTIMTAETPEEGETIIREVLDTANQANEDFETIQTLIGYGKMLFKLVFPDIEI